jgi:hypothetical protein
MMTTKKTKGDKMFCYLGTQSGFGILSRMPANFNNIRNTRK